MNKNINPCNRTREKYIKGIVDTSKLGQTGGTNSFQLSVNTSQAGRHQHNFNNNQNLSGFISSNSDKNASLPVPEKYYLYNEHGDWVKSWGDGSNAGDSWRGNQHRHDLPSTDPDGLHTHSITSTIPTEPSYYQLLKIICIKNK